jgi:hypothetical protein
MRKAMADPPEFYLTSCLCSITHIDVRPERPSESEQMIASISSLHAFWVTETLAKMPLITGEWVP